MLAPLVLLFLVVPLVELYVLIQVGQAIGALETVALLVLASLVGSLLLRAQGRQAWRRFAEALRAGRPPAREVIDGALVIFGGALLITPGFLTDVAGAALLLPPTRAVVRGALVRRLLPRMVVSVARRRGAPTPAPTPRDDLEGRAHEPPGRRPDR